MRQMQSYFNRMIVIRLLQNRLRLGLRPGPRWGSLRRSPRPSNRNCLGALRPRLARKIGFSADRPSGPRSFETHFFGPRPKVFKEHWSKRTGYSSALLLKKTDVFNVTTDLKSLE